MKFTLCRNGKIEPLPVQPVNSFVQQINTEITDEGLPEASGALRNNRRQDEPTGRRRKGGTSQGWRVRTVRRPQGVTKAPRTAGRAGSRTPGLLRGGRPPLDASACSGNLKLLIAWRAKLPQCIPAAKGSQPPSPGGRNPLSVARCKAKPAAKRNRLVASPLQAPS